MNVHRTLSWLAALLLLACAAPASRGAVSISLTPDQSSYLVGSTVTVRVSMGASATEIWGGQFFLAYDSSKLSFVSAAAGDLPFTQQVYSSAASPNVDYAVGAANGTVHGATASTTMAVLKFTAIAPITSTPGLVSFRSHSPPTRLTDSNAVEVASTTSDLPAIAITTWTGTDTYVDDNYVGLSAGTVVNWPSDGMPGPHAIGVDAFATIQGGVNAVSVNGTVHVAAGSYSENVSIAKQITVRGAGSGTNPSSDSVVNAAAGGSPVFMVTSAGTDATHRLTIENFRVTGATGGGNSGTGVRLDNGSFITIDNVTATGNDGNGIAINSTGSMQDVQVLNSTLSSNGLDGMRIPTSLVGLDGLTISNTQFAGNTNIGLEVYATTGHTGLTNVSISNSQFTNNVAKGAYFERLGSANISDISVSGNGTGPSSPAGIDINLKYATYSNIAFNGATFSNNGNGAASGNGLTIKARNDAPSYSGTPATLTGLTLTNVSVTGSPVDLAIGNNVTLGSVSMSGVAINGAGRGLVLFQNTAGQTLNAGDTTFAGTLADYIEETSAGTTTDATGATFNGLAAGALTLAQAFSVVDKIVDDVDLGTSLAGLARIQAGKVFLTPNSFVAPTTTSALVQRAIDAASAGDTIHIQAGTYVGSPSVDKSVTLMGPNVGIDPNVGPRVPEAVLLPDVSDPDPDVAPYPVLLYVSVGSVTIDGLTMDGDNPALTSPDNANGANIDAEEGIVSYEGVGNITVRNNIVKNTSYTGIDFYNYVNDAATSGNTISHNLLTNIGDSLYNWGIGILVYNNFYANVENNVVQDVRVGVQTGNYYRANPGAAATISNNTLAVRRSGIFHNLHYSSASPFTVAGNTITAVDSAGTHWDGITLSSFQTAANTTVQNNIIDGSATTISPRSGYVGWNLPTTADITVGGGTVTGVDYGVWINNYEGYASDAEYTHLTVDGVGITASQAGVYVLDSPSNGNGSSVYGKVTGNCSISGAAVGVKVEGSDSSATVVGNAMSITGNGVGILVDAGKALIENNNLSGNTTAAIRVQNNAKVDAGDCSGSNYTGLGTGSGVGGSSAGGNNLAGYGFDNASPWAVQNDNTSGQFDVLAQNNDFGATAVLNIAAVVHDSADDAGLSTVHYSQSGGQAIGASVASNDYCNFNVPTSVIFTATYSGPGTIEWVEDDCLTGTVIGSGASYEWFSPPSAAGVHTYYARVNDGCATQCASTTITVHAAPVITANISLSGITTGTFSRCISFDVYSASSCPSPAYSHDEPVTFTNGSGTAVFTAPCGTYTCVTARDRLHTLRRTIDAANFVPSGNDYTVNFTGGDALISGNLNDDNFIDILDFGGFIGRYGQSDGPSTSCLDTGRHPDFDGDGTVGTSDFNFISFNFLTAREPDCCSNPLAEGSPTMEISVIDLARSDYEAARTADMNRDGVLNTADVTFLSQHGFPRCQADFFPDGTVNVEDIFVFLNNWFSGFPAADTNDDHAVGVDDIFNFINVWFQGC
jgi:hypothetical protein